MQQPGSVTLQLSDCGRLWFSKIPSMVSPTNLVISAMQPHLPSTPRLSLNLGWPQWFIWLTEAEATLLDSEDRLEGGLNLLLSSLLPLRLFPLRTCSVGSQLSDCEKPWLPRQRRVSVPGGSVSEPSSWVTQLKCQTCESGSLQPLRPFQEASASPVCVAEPYTPRSREEPSVVYLSSGIHGHIKIVVVLLQKKKPCYSAIESRDFGEVL